MLALFKGDVNLDGDVTIRDASILSKADLDTKTINNLQAFIGDANADGSISVRDASIVSKLDLGTGTVKWDIEKVA